MMQLSFLRLGRAGAVAGATASGLSRLSSTTGLLGLGFVVIVAPARIRLAQVFKSFARLVRAADIEAACRFGKVPF
jgi:hypothetical protein